MFLAFVALLVTSLYLFDPHNKLANVLPDSAPIMAGAVFIVLAVLIFLRVRKWRLYIGDMRLCNKLLPLLRKELPGRAAPTKAESVEEVPERKEKRQVIADYESQSTTSGRILILRYFIFPLVVGITLYVCYRIGDELWPKQPAYVFAARDPYSQYHIPTLRKHMPPYVYKSERITPEEATAVGLVGIAARPAAWYFKIALANLSTTATGSLDFQGHCNLTPARWGIYSPSMVIFRDPMKQPALGTIIWVDDKTGRLSVGANEIAAGQSNSVFVIVQSDMRPTNDDLDLRITCPEGEFTQITPLRWDSIGWQTVTPK